MLADRWGKQLSIFGVGVELFIDYTLSQPSIVDFSILQWDGNSHPLKTALGHLSSLGLDMSHRHTEVAHPIALVFGKYVSRRRLPY